MNKRYLAGLLALFVALDLALTFWQNYQFQFDGDLVAIVWPAPWYSQVLHDPFGWAALTKHEVYGATNRFFAHASMALYWKTVPLALQELFSPITRLYVASALFTSATHAIIVLMLAVYIREAAGQKATTWSFWVAAAVLVPLFQTEGYNEQMGVTNRAVTYTFFYALPIALVLVLLWPFYRAACRQQPLRLNIAQALAFIGLMVVISFNGPIATASVAIVLAGIGLYWAVGQGRRLQLGAQPKSLTVGWLSEQALVLLSILAALSLYSIYIGRYNSENTHDHTLGQLYALLPQGIYNQLSHQLGLPVLVLGVLFNAQLVRHALAPSAERHRVLQLLRWVGFFIVMYLLLLPFGGYRPYRPTLLRNDSILPILLALIFAYGLSTYLLIFQLRPGRWRMSYLLATGLFAGIFMYADRKLTMPITNDCERWSMDQLARASEPVVRITSSCTLLSWAPIPDPNSTEYNADMLLYWRITSSRKLYYQK